MLFKIIISFLVVLTTFSFECIATSQTHSISRQDSVVKLNVLASVYNNMGIIHQKLGKLEEALIQELSAS
ncbi:tetratricopeptide repeat protein [Glaciecola sp. KUL10]|uniref:tetratricopeptide repeat protein n=1 Tax=Glaciecola sp. (strain KUL10) TaxID=2161813 RepID=UPI000D9E2F7E|nr:tetratricopeptide repeat protein [Glaciecola sp. KUL10]GBL03845.1 hypothetical protein KUL10_11450 [Glaciecola sp. KUL10]